MKRTWIYINSLVRVLCSPLCFKVKHGQLLQYPRHLSEKLSDRELNVWAAAFQIQQVDSPFGMLSRHPLSTLATVSATLPVVLSSRPLGMTVAGLSLAWYHIHEICSHNFKVFCILSVGICDHVWKEGNLHSLLLLQLPRLPLTIRRMVSRDGDWLSVARATGLSADGGSRLPFLGGKQWRKESECASLGHLFLLWLIGHPHILPSAWLQISEISAVLCSETALIIKFHIESEWLTGFSEQLYE